MHKIYTFLFCLFPILVFGQEISWRPTPHPTDFSVSKLLAIEGIILSFTYGGEVFSSEDGGESWHSITDRPQHFAFKDVLYIEGHGLFAATSHHGIFVSQDFGKSWEESNTELTCLVTNNLSNDESYLYVSTSNGIFQRELSGRTWRKMELPKGGYSTYIHTVEATPIGIFAGGVNALYYTGDQGRTWASYQNSEFTDVISLSWFDNKLLVGTSGRGVFNLDTPERDWREEVEVESARSVRVVDKLFSINGSIVILSGDIGLGIDNEIPTTGLPDRYLMDFIRLEENDLASTRFYGIYTTKPAVMGLQNPSTLPAMENSLSGLKIYPTITASEINVEISSPSQHSESVNTIRLLNSAGSIVKEITLGNFNPKQRISIGDLPAGNYWCQVTLGQKVYHQLIILSK
ncbi:hypothetical protein QWY85_10690 [Neolewinella lacunae]|uniref:Uncharacterized protein n=1 Tax=Neolewinella lacunae TaxID=1517758 RepID=A0A923PKV5_9BACT|nr:hypothetical protein [Neolewinella lacunae]MBC6993154.1 hypothetical protein [Neolewinella lacunae]MDN3635125.1 hypothetical protein [Neolewinella lacunae]